MPEITFGKNNRIISCKINGHLHPSYGEVDEGIEEAWSSAEEDSPFDTLERWYIAGIKHPRLIAIDSDCDYRDEPVAQWKIWYNHIYAERKAGNYVMTCNGKRFNP